MIKPMKMFYIKPEMDIELVEVEAFLAQSVGFSDEEPDPKLPYDAPEFTLE